LSRAPGAQIDLTVNLKCKLVVYLGLRPQIYLNSIFEDPRKPGSFSGNGGGEIAKRGMRVLDHERSHFRAMIHIKDEIVKPWAELMVAMSVLYETDRTEMSAFADKARGSLRGLWEAYAKLESDHQFMTPKMPF
jgi:hypothetical protein